MILMQKDSNDQKKLFLKPFYCWRPVLFCFSKNANDANSPETDLSEVFPCLSSSACWDTLQPQHTSLSWTLFYRMFLKHSQLFAGPRTWKSSLGLQTVAGEPPEKKNKGWIDRGGKRASAGPAPAGRLPVWVRASRDADPSDSSFKIPKYRSTALLASFTATA